MTCLDDAHVDLGQKEVSGCMKGNTVASCTSSFCSAACTHFRFCEKVQKRLAEHNGGSRQYCLVFKIFLQ